VAGEKAMVFLGTWKGQRLTISVKSNCLTVAVERPTGTNVFSFDLEGRLWTGTLEGVTYRRGLDGKVVAKWRVPGTRMGRQRRWLSPTEGKEIEARARRFAASLLADLRAGSIALNHPLPDRGWSGFERAAAFDGERSRADAEQYARIYQPVGILPPDQYMAVVLQATEGCSFNTCTFCTFYKDRPFRIKTPDEFRAHAQGVRAFLGRGLSLRRTVFLGDANALVIPMSRLVPLMQITRDVYDVEGLGGVYAFLDGFSGEKKSSQDYAGLAALGLKRVYIGMESGDPDLLKFLKKPGQPEDVIAAVRAIKAGGVAVGVIVLLGAGGKTYARGHVKRTVDALNAMRLGMDDIIYFSELITSEGMPYVHDAYQAHLGRLSHEERIQQGETIQSNLTFSQRGGTPHISRYDIREFVY
jgi:hypothetical protein